MSAEIDLQVPEKSTSPELMGKLIESFGNEKWKYLGGWINREGQFRMYMASKLGHKIIEYQDFGRGPEGSSTEFNFFDEGAHKFTLRQVVNIVDDKPESIENHILVAPFKDAYFDPEWGYGIHYLPDGKMSPRRRIKGLPLKIDMDATVTAFIEQVIAANFRRPQLIRPQK